MTRYYTQYCANATWEDMRPSEGICPDHFAGNLFRKKGVVPGDQVYVVTVIKGSLYLLSKLVVAIICDVEEAASHLHCEPASLWVASDHVLAAASTPMHFGNGIPSDVTSRLRFVSEDHSHLRIAKPSGLLDQQTLRGVRELAAESAQELDRFLPPLEVIDFESEGQTEANSAPSDDAGMPETYLEGPGGPVLVNSYERNGLARRRCIAHYGAKCYICGLDFREQYGGIGAGFIAVHHLRQVSETKTQHAVDPTKDLRPVCPNCHGMIHRRKRPYTIDEIKNALKR